MQKVQCDKHGLQDETFVCQHIVATLVDGVPRGFHWANSDRSRPDAWCSRCNETSNGGDWTPETERAAGVKLLCGACYDAAKALNGF
jgi:hypothetical protein